jgi:FKBP-type peptidyl-prolyl cis-trans isomerase (trigger factor)
VREEVTKAYRVYISRCSGPGLAPVEMPKIDVSTKKLEEEKEFVYTLTEVTPEVNIDDYKGMGLKKNSVEVSDKDTERAKRPPRRRASSRRSTGGASGDMVVVDFEAFLKVIR